MVQDILLSQNTHPLFDDLTNKLVRTAISAGVLNIGSPSVKKGKHIGLVADLFDRLPVYDIPMDELLDIRKELGKPLIFFRSEIVKLSNEIENAVWDDDFSYDVQTTFQSKIEPAVLEIEEKLKSTTFREFWTRRIVDKYTFLAGSLGGAYVLGATVSPIAGIAAGLVSASVFTESSFSEWIEKRNEIERNGMYFYFKVKNSQI